MSENIGMVVVDLSDPLAAQEMFEAGMKEEVDFVVSDIEDPIRRQQAAEVVRRDFLRRHRII